MGRIFGGIIVLLCCTILLAAAVQAKTPKEVYLKDGGIIECQKVWRANGKVMGLVNRDTLVDLSRDEVDLQKTFAEKPVKGVKKGTVRKKIASKPGAVMPLAVPQPPAKPNKVAATAQDTGTAPIAKPAPPASPRIAAPAAKQALPAVAQPSPIKPAVQGAATSAQKPTPAAAPSARTSLPIAKQSAFPVKEPPTISRNMVVSYMIYFLLLMILMIVALCKVFAKAGEAWWKAIIPIYNLFVLVIISGKPWWWGLLLFIPIVNIVFIFIVHIALARRFGQGVVFGLGLVLVGIVFFPLLAFGKYEYN
jgi:hypothetical protein